MTLSVAMYAAGKAGQKARDERIAELESMLKDYQAAWPHIRDVLTDVRMVLSSHANDYPEVLADVDALLIWKKQ